MVALSELKEMARRPELAAETAKDAAGKLKEKATRHPYQTGGIVLLIAGLVGFYFIFPEIRRYMRIERM